MIQRMLAIWSLVPGKSHGWRSLVGYSPWGYKESDMTEGLHFLLVCEMSATVKQFEHSLTLPFFGIGMKTDFFQFCGHCRDFQICWHIECSMLTASPFMIWNSSTGIPSPPPVHLTLFLSTLIFVHISGSSLNVNFSIKFFLISQVDLTYACVLFPEKQFIELWPRTGWQELRSRLCRVQSTGIYL